MNGPHTLLTVAALALGAITGSFLGCLVYRMPRGISLLRPARSFCPACGRTIPWYRNVPVVGWFISRGRCPECGGKISPRYPLLEACSAFLFWEAAVTFPPAHAVALWVFFAVLLAAAFIDVEHLIIPDRLTFPGTAIGIVCSGLVPGLHGASDWRGGLWAAVLGAGAGYGALYAVSYFGKAAFGRFNITSTEPIEFKVRVSDGGRREFVFDQEVYPWDELFFRKRDRIRIETQTLTLNQRPEGAREIVFGPDSLRLGTRVMALSDVAELAGSTKKAQFPREAMGFGDVKLMAVIGAFLGWPGAIFSIAAASLLGTVVGSALLAFRKIRSTEIPFGPYLACGALVWSFIGRQLASWYLHRLLG